MTYREKFVELKNIDNKYLTVTIIRELLINDGGFNDVFNLYKHLDEPLKDEKKLNDNLKRILSGEPYQYVLGYAYFINSNYKVTPNVLIPRQETEQLAIDAVVRIVKSYGENPKITIVDVGTGSGILAIYLKEKLPSANVIAVDISEKALEVARENAKIHGVCIDFRLSDMLSNVEEKIDVLISNPPYIPNEDTVDEQTLKYEPHLALFASPKTKYYEILLKEINGKMNEEFDMFFEIGEDMKQELTDILEEQYPGIAYAFKEDICYKTRFLHVARKKEFKKYE